MHTATPTQDAHLSGRPAWFAHRNGAVPDTAMHFLSEAMDVMGADGDAWARAQAVCQTWVRAGTLLYGEGSAVQGLYVVRHGSFKILRFGEDGYEHVLGFAAAGDVIGFEGLAGNRQPLGVAALEDSSVLVLPVASLEAWRRQSPALDHALLRAVGAQLTRARDTAAMAAAVASEVRLARFLVWMSQQMAERGQPPLRFQLCMSRRDIASMLAVAHETVSRGFGHLAEWGYVTVDNRNVEILDMPGLKACTLSTRRDMDDPHHRTVSAAGARPAEPGSGYVRAQASW